MLGTYFADEPNIRESPNWYSTTILSGFRRQILEEDWVRWGLLRLRAEQLKATQRAAQNQAVETRSIAQLGRLLATACLLRICARSRQLLRVLLFRLLGIYFAIGSCRPVAEYRDACAAKTACEPPQPSPPGQSNS